MCFTIQYYTSWSILFQALAEMAFLDTMVLVTMLRFWEVDTVAGMLFVPYAAWLGLATSLTVNLWKANPKWRYGYPTKNQ